MLSTTDSQVILQPEGAQVIIVDNDSEFTLTFLLLCTTTVNLLFLQHSLLPLIGIVTQW